MKSSLSPVRCAIYTRKSNDEGLEQEFTSLDAQREICAEYINSHRDHGWIQLSDTYDDGGFSGGTLKRPGLKRLRSDIQSGLIDVVLVYKIDRLARKMFDSLKLRQEFEVHNVRFISVTEKVDDRTALGEYMLNQLSCQAQFFRDMTIERTRDKIALSKRKGMWMGGVPPLGYDAKDRALVINEKEAKLVRHIFIRFTTLRSITLLTRELRAQGIRTKSYTRANGQSHTGALIDKGFLYKLLSRRIYLGEIPHKGQFYPGRHEAILEQDLWDKAHAYLNESPRAKANHTRRQTPALLKGLLFCSCCNRALTPTHTRKAGGKLYRYYLPTTANIAANEECQAPTVPAGEIEKIIMAQLHTLFQSPEMVVKNWKLSKEYEHSLSEAEISTLLRHLDPVWNELFPAEQARIIQLLIEKIVVSPDNVDIRIRTDGLSSFVKEMAAVSRRKVA